MYAPTASGDSPPTRTLTGPATGLNKPFGLALDLVHDELVVADYGNNAITVYARTAQGDIAPLRTLAGPATGLNQPSCTGCGLSA